MNKFYPCIKELNWEGSTCLNCNRIIPNLEKKNVTELNNLSPHCAMVSHTVADKLYFRNPLRKFALAALLAFGTGLFTISAQDEIKTDSVQTANEFCITFNGTILSEDGETIAFANVFITESDEIIAGASSNLEGKYSFNLVRNAIDTTKIKLEVRFIGFQNISVDLDTLSKEIVIENNFILKEDIDFILVGLYISDPKFVEISDPDNHRKTVIQF